VHDLAQQLLFLRIQVTVDVDRRHRAKALANVERRRCVLVLEP